jgi:CRISPR/Cas system CSM-associated protein Csm2 small subunit
VLKLSELRDYPRETIRRIYLELGVSDQFFPNFNKKYNVTKNVRSKWFAKQTARILNEQNKIKKSIKILLPVSTTNLMGNMLRSINKSEKNYKPMSFQTKKILTEFYRLHNDKLSSLLNDDFTNWNKII